MIPEHRATPFGAQMPPSTSLPPRPAEILSQQSQDISSPKPCHLLGTHLGSVLCSKGWLLVQWPVDPRASSWKNSACWKGGSGPGSSSPAATLGELLLFLPPALRCDDRRAAQKCDNFTEAKNSEPAALEQPSLFQHLRSGRRHDMQLPLY